MDNLSSSSPHESVKIIGRPVQLIMEIEKHITFNAKQLDEILCDPLLSSRHICIISIIGPIRKGKSFLLNLFLKFISMKQNNNWLSHLDQPLEGFSWHSGINSELTGIVMWSEPFFIKIDEEDWVVLLLDVQGTFNKFSSLNDCTQMAALGLLFSSHVILNIPEYLDEDMLDFTEMFINYANYIIGSWCTYKPFQNMLVIIRDWNFSQLFPYGLHGGELYLKYLSKVTKDTAPKSILKDKTSKQTYSENLFFKHSYKNIFHQIQCFLLPHPGYKVTTNPNFDGRIRDMHPLFIDQLKMLIPQFFTPESLQCKKMNDHFFTCKEYFQYFKSIIHIINTESLPPIRSLMTENGFFDQLEFTDHIKGFYIASMDKIVTAESGYIHNNRLDEEHRNLMFIIQSKLNNSRMFDKSTTLDYTKEMIEASLNDIYEKYKIHNKNKNLHMSIFTPFSLVIILTASYLIYNFAKLLKVPVIVDVTEKILYVVLGINLLWIASCYWEIEFLSAILDQLTNILVLYLYNPLISVLKSKPAKILNPFYNATFIKPTNSKE